MDFRPVSLLKDKFGSTNFKTGLWLLTLNTAQEYCIVSSKNSEKSSLFCKHDEMDILELHHVIYASTFLLSMNINVEEMTMYSASFFYLGKMLRKKQTTNKVSTRS